MQTTVRPTQSPNATTTEGNSISFQTECYAIVELDDFESLYI